jgi:uncharacterized oxidoreductase
MQISNNKILITGGATGIGLGLTEALLQAGNTVLICGRREPVLQEVANRHKGIIYKVCDLSLASERESLFQWIQTEHADLNVLVNNAGIQKWMEITDAGFYEKARQEISVNIEAPIHLCSLFLKLPALTTIINITSGLSFMPLVKVPVYSATKAFFHSFTRSLRQFLKKRNVEVIEIIPPAINTDLGGKGLHDTAPPVHEFITAIMEQLQSGKTTCTFGFSTAISEAGPKELEQFFERMNGE